MSKLTHLITFQEGFFEENFPIWRIDDDNISAMKLYQSAGDRYRVIEDGALPNIFCSLLYIVVSEYLLQHLVKEVGDQLEYYPVTIYDRGIDSNIDGYYRLVPNTTEDFEDLITTEHQGKRIWIKEGSNLVFITEELKNILLKAEIKDIIYIPGMSFLG